jgi:hypothetical protein
VVESGITFRGFSVVPALNVVYAAGELAGPGRGSQGPGL